VEGPAIALDDDPPVHEEVHPADPADLDLQLDGTTERAQEQPRQRLRPGLGPAVDKLPELLETLRKTLG
jgi:hypothetical protein